MPLAAPSSIRGTDGAWGWHLVALDIDVLHNQNALGQGVRIAVIDTGVRRTCPALTDAALTVLASDGRVDGKDGADGNDYGGHGTSMIAILVGSGIAVCPGAAITSIAALVVDPLTGDGRASATAIAQAIGIALDRGVDVISISAGQDEPDPALAGAVSLATAAGIVVVAAGDNSSTATRQYPANCDTAISVTRSSSRSEIVHLVTPAHADLAAPGEDIATYSYDTPNTQSGTSEATAIVAGICALLLGEAPSDRRAVLGKHMRGLLMETARTASNATGSGDCKIIDPLAALDRVEAWLAGQRNL